MLRFLLALTAASTLTLTACGEGFDTEEATATCNEERAANSNCFDDDAFNRCVSCHEECGDACGTVDTVCPARFSCPSDE
jgi:hypothetical protein